MALHPHITHGSLLCSAVIFFYTSYLTFSALSSEPSGYACNGRATQQAGAGQAATATGMAVTVLSVVWSAFRTGSSSEALIPRQTNSPAAGTEDGEAYNELAECVRSASPTKRRDPPFAVLLAEDGRRAAIFVERRRRIAPRGAR